MASYTRRQLARRDDLRAADHLPTCPRCGDLLDATALVCVECGALVLLSADAAELRSLGRELRRIGIVKGDTEGATS